LKRILVCLVGLSLLCSVVGQERWHAGYAFRYYEWSAPWGVSASIYTINPSVGSHFLVQWDMIVLSYYPLYWIQIGYDKGSWWPTRLRYYKEKKDQTGGWVREKFSDGPAVGSWHTYTVVHAQEVDPKKWRLFIDGGDRGYYIVYPYAPIDHQSFVETNDPGISIYDSEHNYLSYYTGRTWEYWYAHVKAEMYPYWVADLGHYHFIAGGGG